MNTLGRSKPFALAFNTKGKPGSVIVDVVRFETYELRRLEFDDTTFTILNPDEDRRAKVMFDAITRGRPLIRVVAAHAPECASQVRPDVALDEVPNMHCRPDRPACDCHARGWGEPGDVLLEFKSAAGYVRLNMTEVCDAIDDGRLALPSADNVAALRQWIEEQQPTQK